MRASRHRRIIETVTTSTRQRVGASSTPSAAAAPEYERELAACRAPTGDLPSGWGIGRRGDANMTSALVASARRERDQEQRHLPREREIRSIRRS